MKSSRLAANRFICTAYLGPSQLQQKVISSAKLWFRLKLHSFRIHVFYTFFIGNCLRLASLSSGALQLSARFLMNVLGPPFLHGISSNLYRRKSAKQFLLLRPSVVELMKFNISVLGNGIWKCCLSLRMETLIKRKCYFKNFCGWRVCFSAGRCHKIPIAPGCFCYWMNFDSFRLTWLCNCRKTKHNLNDFESLWDEYCNSNDCKIDFSWK